MHPLSRDTSPKYTACIGPLIAGNLLTSHMTWTTPCPLKIQGNIQIAGNNVFMKFVIFVVHLEYIVRMVQFHF